MRYGNVCIDNTENFKADHRKGVVLAELRNWFLAHISRTVRDRKLGENANL